MYQRLQRIKPHKVSYFIVFDSVIPEKAEQCAAQRTAVSSL